jgi:hypothetical protein
MPPSGVGAWSGFSIPPTSSVTLSFKVKPLQDVSVLEVLVWSAAKQDNGHFVVENLRKGEWREIKVPLTEIRIGWGKDAPSIDVVENLKFFFRGAAEARVLLDDIEIRG